MPSKKSKPLAFEQFRYQILPINKNIQLTILGDILSYDDFVQKKNKFLADVLRNERLQLTYSKSKVQLRYEGDSEGIFIFRLNVSRKIKRNTEDFKEEQLENYPHLTIIINNNPDKQIIAIEKNFKAFDSVETVSHILEKNLSKYLKALNLAIYVEPIYDKQDFWSIIEQYKNRIRQIDFELIRPNMSNISSSIDEDLKALERSVDAHKLHLGLRSNPNSALSIETTNPHIKGLVDYASEGGGNVSVRVKGLKSKIKTTGTPKEISIDELDFNNLPPDVIAAIFKQIM